MNLKRHILIISLIAFLFACKSKKHIVDGQKLKNLPAKVLIDSLQNNEFDFDWLRSKGTATIYFQEEKHSIKANFRVRKDSALWNNLSKGPVQISTALLSQDSVKLLKKVKEKEYFLGNYDYINKLLNADVDMKLLQDYISGNPILFDFEGKYKSKTDNGQYLISSNRSNRIDKLLKRGIEKGKVNKKHDVLYRCWVNPDNFKCSKVEINLLSDSNSIVVNYSDWIDVDGQLFPENSSINVYTSTDSVTLEMKYSKNVKINVPQTFPFKITDNYTPLNF